MIDAYGENKHSQPHGLALALTFRCESPIVRIQKGNFYHPTSYIETPEKLLANCIWVVFAFDEPSPSLEHERLSSSLLSLSLRDR